MVGTRAGSSSASPSSAPASVPPRSGGRRRSPSREQSRDDAGCQTEHVRERRRAEHDVVRPELERVGAVPGGGMEAPMRQDRSLRPAGGAGGEEDHRWIGALPFDGLRGRPNLGAQPRLRPGGRPAASTPPAAPPPRAVPGVRSAARGSHPAARLRVPRPRRPGPFGSISATRSPGSTPRSTRRAVAASARRPSSA